MRFKDNIFLFNNVFYEYSYIDRKWYLVDSTLSVRLEEVKDRVKIFSLNKLRVFDSKNRTE